MPLFKKLFGCDERVPDWASSLKPAEFSEFIARIRADLDRRGLSHRLDLASGVIYLESSSAQSLGLINVLQLCRNTSPEQWPSTIQLHFDVLSSADDIAQLVTGLAENLQRALPYLKVRLQPANYSELGTAVTKPVADDLISVLVYDLPTSIVNVRQNHVDDWGMPVDELFETALRNVREAGLLAPDSMTLANGVRLVTYEDHKNFFGATHALLLDDYLRPAPALGALVGIPHRHGMLLQTLGEGDPRRGLMAMAYMVPQLYQQGPGSIISSVYWWHRGELTRLPFRHNEQDAAVFTLPDRFRETVLNGAGAGW